MRTVPVLADLPQADLEWLLEQTEEQRIEPGKVFIRENDPADKMVALLEGEVARPPGKWRAGFAGGHDPGTHHDRRFAFFTAEELPDDISRGGSDARFVVSGRKISGAVPSHAGTDAAVGGYADRSR